MSFDFSQGMERFSRLVDPAGDDPKSVDMVTSRIGALGEDLAQ